MQDQIETILFQLAEARRMHGVSERDGTIDSVFRQNGEQKVRVNIGMRPDGSPWLTPWLKVEDHHGAARHQHKWHKGQNVKVSTVGADLSKATVKPHGENINHKEPDHADDINETSQYAAHRTRTGPDFAEHWLAGVGATEQTTQSTNSKDPDKVSVVLTRWGAKPPAQPDKLQPWEGPPPTGGDAQKRHMTWAGTAGNTPTQSGDAIVTQFDKNVKTEHTEDHVMQKVQSGGIGQMPIPDSLNASGGVKVTISHLMDGVLTHIVHDTGLNKIVSAIHTDGSITHTVTDAMGNTSTILQQAQQMIHQVQGQDEFSVITQGSGQIMHQVGNSLLQILKSEINISSGNVNVNGQAIQGFSQPPVSPGTTNGDSVPVIGTLWSIEAGLVVATTLL